MRRQRARLDQERRQIRRERTRLRHERAAARRARAARQVKHVAVAAAAQPACNHNYDPCLKFASDYDCAGGSGDGPAYTGYVRVVGNDDYDLDRDGDGVACAS